MTPCPHGWRVHRCGISSRSGGPYSGEFCPVDVCPPTWNPMDCRHQMVTGNANRIAYLSAQVRLMECELRVTRAELRVARALNAPSLRSIQSSGAIYNDRVGKLLNLAIGADSDHEAELAFRRARDQYRRIAV